MGHILMRPVRTRPWRALPSDKKMQWAPLTLGLCSRKPPPLQPEQVIHLPEPGQAPVHPVRHGQHSGLSGLRHRHGEWGFRPASTRLSAPTQPLSTQMPWLRAAPGPLSRGQLGPAPVGGPVGKDSGGDFCPQPPWAVPRSLPRLPPMSSLESQPSGFSGSSSIFPTLFSLGFAVVSPESRACAQRHTCDLILNLALPTALWGRYSYPHCSEEGPEALMS